MKKVAFIMAGLLAIMLAGCGEGSSTSSTTVQDIGTEVNTDTSEVAGLSQFPAVPTIPES